MTRATPVISVVMPVYNAERYLRQSVDSVLSQSFPDFELIMIDDGSTDGSRRILETFIDDRIRMRVREHRGLSFTRNEALAMARGEFVALMDADDVSAPDRFQVQTDFLRHNPAVGIVGSWAETVDRDGEVLQGTQLRPPCTDTMIRMQMLHGSCFVNGSTVFRRQGGEGAQYQDNYAAAEDYDFWLQLLPKWRVANLPSHLYLYRIHGASATHALSPSALRALTERVVDAGVENLIARVTGQVRQAPPTGSFERSETRSSETPRQPVTRIEYETLWMWSVEAVVSGRYMQARQLARAALTGVRVGDVDCYLAILAALGHACFQGHLIRRAARAAGRRWWRSWLKRSVQSGAS